jgi:hypothetical protein
MSRWTPEFFKNLVPRPTQADLEAEIEEFVSALDSLPYVTAKIVRHNKLEDVRSVVTHPRHRPSEAAHVISYRASDSRIMIISPDRTELTTPAAVREYLERFAKTTQFPNTLRYYELRASEPYEAILHTGSFQTHEEDDSLISLPEGEQATVSGLNLGETATVTVCPVEDSPLAPLAQDVSPYRYLTSSGFVLQIDGIERGGDEDATMRIRVTRVAEEDSETE